MIVVFDTNIILDAVMDRPDSEVAQKLIRAVVDDRITGVVTANSITDIHYLVKKYAGEDRARTAVYHVLCVFDTVSVDGDVCMAALNLPMGDYEDAVLAACAVRANATCVVTRDTGFLEDEGSPVQVLTPAEVLKTIEFGE